MSNLNHRDRERLFSIDRKKLTLSGSKISISSLSNSLIQFFQASQNTSQSQVNVPSKKRTQSSYCLAKQTNNRKPNKVQLASTDFSSHDVDEYGLQQSNQRKKLQKTSIKQQSQKKLRIASINYPNQNSNYSNQSQTHKLILKQSSANIQSTPYLNFTFGNEGRRFPGWKDHL